MMVCMDPALPWWWLRADEQRALGIGEGAQRTELGVVFGNARSPLRIELVAPHHDGPLRLGPLTVRLWGNAPDGAARLASLRGVLARRPGTDFRPDDVAWPIAEPAGGRVPSSTITHIIDVPSVCDRACTFCGVSQTAISRRTVTGSAIEVERRIAALEPTSVALFTGMDALVSPFIVDWVAAASARGARAQLIGPPRLHESAALAVPLARAGLRRYQTGLFGADAATHDVIAGRDGAFGALHEASAAFTAAGVEVELVTPLIAPLLAHLPAIVEAALVVTPQPLTLLAYAPDPVVGRAFDAQVAPYDTLGRALSALTEPRVRVDALPLCVLPHALRQGASHTLERTDEALVSEYPAEVCGPCVAKSRCPGVPRTVLTAVGTRGLAPLTR